MEDKLSKMSEMAHRLVRSQNETTGNKSASVRGWAEFREKARKWYVDYFAPYAFFLGCYVGAVCMLIYIAYATKLWTECLN